tara:strand:- start:2518 stop:3456 length:939 start_codon:yes stop_codon:yes gene_type:complete
MAVEIKSGATSDLLTVDAVSKAVRVTNYDSNGEERLFHPLPVSIATSDVTQVDNDVIDAVDVGEYKWVSLQLAGTFVATIAFQGSNDNGTFYDVIVQNPGLLSEPYVTNMTGTGLVKIPVLYKYLRARVTSYTSGTVEGIAFGYKESNDSGQISSTGTIDGTVSVDNFPATQDVSGSVSVSNLPATQPVSGEVTIVGNTSLSPFYAIGTTGTNETGVSSVPSVLRSIVFTNLAATPRHLKLYDDSAIPAAGVGFPVIVCSMAAAGTLAFPLPVEGFPFANGIGFTMVLGAANNSASPATTQPDFTVSMIYSS